MAVRSYVLPLSGYRTCARDRVSDREHIIGYTRPIPAFLIERRAGTGAL